MFSNTGGFFSLVFLLLSSSSFRYTRMQAKSGSPFRGLNTTTRSAGCAVKNRAGTKANAETLHCEGVKLASSLKA